MILKMDNYCHTDSSVVYVSESILGPLQNTDECLLLENNFNSQLDSFCSCEGLCSDPKCACVSKSGGANYTTDTSGKYTISSNKTNCNILYPIFECNSMCNCLNSCGNRVVQNGPIDGLETRICADNSFQNRHKGLGLFTTKLINKGSFICEYAGEIITKAQAMQRQFMNKTRGKMNYIFCLNEHSNGIVTQTIIDPSEFGNIGRYINHSCDPNSEILPVRVDMPIPKLAVFAKANIMPNSEITFDYGSHNIQSPNEAERKECLCGSLNCKGWLPFESYG